VYCVYSKRFLVAVHRDDCPFRPLAWLTGFFGQNFGYLVRSIGGWEAFVGLGVGTELVALAILLALFRRRGWF
jgi:magnesium transporter